MKDFQLIVNFKTYENATGTNALELAKIHQKVAEETGVGIAIAVQAVDLRHIAQEVGIPVLAQHFDFVKDGVHTGHVTAQALKESGAYGTLLNHAERKIELDDIEESVDLARQLGLFTIVCADTPYTGKAVAALNPHMVAVEPPELIGGDVSVCSANPQILMDAVAMIENAKVVIGAGIKSKEDVAHAIKHGASAVLVASGVIRSMHPEETLKELAQGVIEGQKGAVEHTL